MDQCHKGCVLLQCGIHTPHQEQLVSDTRYTKDFAGWSLLKEQVHDQTKPRTFNRREVWWCTVGVNVGHEVDGKNAVYNRPVLIVRKFNKNTFWGVPLTSQLHDSPYHYPITFRGKEQRALITQLRLFDSRRLTHPMGRLSDEDYEAVCSQLRSMI